VTVGRIGVLVCDHVAPALQPIAGEYADMFAALLPSLDLVAYDARAGELPASPDECDGWLCTGSSASVYDGAPWIDAVAELVREVRDAAVPFVGICFGHQLLGHALGGRVERAATGWGVGAHVAQVTETAAWMDPPLDTVGLLYSHQDQVVQLPPGGRVAASADHCPVAMLSVGETMLGIQGHPEFSAAYVDALVAGRVERIGADRVRAARDSLDQPRDEAAVARWIASFLRR
jgi:GMP synthase-like glutamine amidotransferase